MRRNLGRTLGIGALVVGLGALAPASPALAGGSMGYPANFPDRILAAGECQYRELWQNPDSPSFTGKFIRAQRKKSDGKVYLSTVKKGTEIVGCDNLGAWFPE